MSIKVMLADGQALFRAGIRNLLEADGDIEVTAEAGNGEECIARIMEWEEEASLPQILLLDMDMPDGVKVLCKVKEYMPEMKVSVLAAHEEPEYLSRALDMGADGYLSKDCSLWELRESIRTVINGITYIQPRLSHLSEDRISCRNGDMGTGEKDGDREKYESLTARERQVLEQVAEGLLNKEIAVSLDISEQTVKNHLYNVFRKLDVLDRTQAAVFAIRNHLI